MPRLFPCCGHSFCSFCIGVMIENKPSEITCPEDGKIEEFYSPERGLDSFPINFALKNILEKHQRENNKTTIDSNTFY